MTIEDADWISELLGPTLEDTSRWTFAISDGRLAVIILDEPANLTRADFIVALRLHDALDSALLIVL